MEAVMTDLNDLLIDWHHWAKRWSPHAEPTTGSMWRGVKSSRQWEDTLDIADQSQHNATMQAIDFCVGEMEPAYRTAIGIHARNLATGVSVWSSPRLPSDLQSRAQLLALAKQALSASLAKAGLLG
jgi:hypothetical protein